ncbi:MAG TPA: polymer-forming cytoskeletal protein [Gemmatimonadales bacterium]|nr:polymer-forming cytoskeletal protein [Gemmatimonadales bacterium]
MGPEATEEAIVVVGGNARVEGAARLLMVVDGDAVLSGARVEELMVVRGRAELIEGATVTGNVHLMDADVSVAEGAQVLGTIERGYGLRVARGIWAAGAVFALGLSIALLLSGLVAAAVAPGPLRAAGRVLTVEFGPTLLAAAVIWIALPLAAVIVLATVVGIPTALGFFIFVMPAIGFLGYLVAGTRIGDLILEKTRGRVEPDHPYLAACIGIGILLIASWMPVLGKLVTSLAGILGGGAVGVLAWRAARRRTATPTSPAPAPVHAAGM